MIKRPMIWTINPSKMVVWSGLIKSVAPFGCTVWAIFRSSLVIFHSDKCATGGGLDIRLTARVLDYSFTSVLISSGHVERSSIFFTAVESQLGERQDWSQLIHGGFCENHLITGHSTVWSLDWQLRRRSWTNHNVGNEEPSSWNEKLFFNKEKQPFVKAADIL